jgi:hypothetical protein
MNITVTAATGTRAHILDRLSLLRRTNFYSGGKASPDVTYAGELTYFRARYAEQLAVAYYFDRNSMAYRHGPIVDATGLSEREASVAATGALVDYYNSLPAAEEITAENAELLAKLQANESAAAREDDPIWWVYTGNNARPFRSIRPEGDQFSFTYAELA